MREEALRVIVAVAIKALKRAEQQGKQIYVFAHQVRPIHNRRFRISCGSPQDVVGGILRSGLSTKPFG